MIRVAGFVIAAIGLWRLGRHLGGFGEHEHREGSGMGGRGLIGLGIAGGMVPCWDAVLMVVLADLAGRLALGLLLLSAFSLGMASVLVVVGVTAGRLRSYVDERDQEGRWERRIGTVQWTGPDGGGVVPFRDVSLGGGRPSSIYPDTGAAVSLRSIELIHAAVPLKKTIKHASHERTTSDNLVVRATLRSGEVGYGEGVPRPYVTGETIETAFEMLKGFDAAAAVGEPGDYAAVVRDL